MRVPFGRGLIVLALTFSLGAHWTFLQSIAWVGMAWNYSRNASLAQALEQTFDGEHPCKLCKFVEEGAQSQKKQEMLKFEGEKKFVAQAKLTIPVRPSSFILMPAFTSEPVSRHESPPVPPPRSIFA